MSKYVPTPDDDLDRWVYDDYDEYDPRDPLYNSEIDVIRDCMNDSEFAFFQMIHMESLRPKTEIGAAVFALANLVLQQDYLQQDYQHVIDLEIGKQIRSVLDLPRYKC